MRQIKHELLIKSYMARDSILMFVGISQQHRHVVPKSIFQLQLCYDRNGRRTYITVQGKSRNKWRPKDVLRRKGMMRVNSFLQRELVN